MKYSELNPAQKRKLHQALKEKAPEEYEKLRQEALRLRLRLIENGVSEDELKKFDEDNPVIEDLIVE